MNLINKYKTSNRCELSLSYDIANSIFSGSSYLKFLNGDIGYSFMVNYKNPQNFELNLYLYNITVFDLMTRGRISLDNYETCGYIDTHDCLNSYDSCDYCCNNKSCIMINNKEEAIEVASILRSLIINNS